MRFALITTTIHEPEVLRYFRACGPSVPFVIAADKKTPDLEPLAGELRGCRVLTPAWQENAYPGLSAALGWNTVQRRNIALLEAMRFKPDVIVSIDDNLPEGDYFRELEASFRGGEYAASDSWFNLGELAQEPFTYRGFPLSEEPRAEVCANGEPHMIGVVNGLILGDPDINATERIEANPHVDSYDNAAFEGIVLDPARTWSPINSQNTAWRAELAPLAMVFPGVGRYDDILASYVAQAVLSTTAWQVMFGQPAVRQERNKHNLVADLRDELWGMEHVPEIVERLRSARLRVGAPILENLARALAVLDLEPEFCREWIRAWRALEK